MARVIEWQWEFDRDDRKYNYFVAAELNDIRRHEIMAEAEERVRDRVAKFAVIHVVEYEDGEEGYYELGVVRRLRFGPTPGSGTPVWTSEVVGESPPDPPPGVGLSRFEREPLV